jgi:hypothetical protein
MTMLQLAKEVFLLVGAMLGVLAFCKTMLDPVMESNRKKWEEIKKHLDEDDFITLDHEVWDLRRISVETINKFTNFIVDIEQDAEYLRFGPVLRSQFASHLLKLRSHYREFRQYVKSPYWDTDSRFDNDPFFRGALVLNKLAFAKPPHNKIEDYTVNLFKAAELVETMRVDFRSIGILANLHVLEIPFARRVIRNLAPLPELEKRNAAEMTAATAAK